MTAYLTAAERADKEQERKERRFVRNVLGLKTTLARTIFNNIQVTLPHGEVYRKFHESGLASSIEEAGRKVRKYVDTGEKIEMFGRWSPTMTFQEVENGDDIKIRMTYREWDL